MAKQNIGFFGRNLASLLDGGRGSIGLCTYGEQGGGDKLFKNVLLDLSGFQ